jgi:hypothetical protein
MSTKKGEKDNKISSTKTKKGKKDIAGHLMMAYSRAETLPIAEKSDFKMDSVMS